MFSLVQAQQPPRYMQQAPKPQPPPQQLTKTATIRNSVNLKKATLRLQPLPGNPQQLLISFTFDNSAPCRFDFVGLAATGGLHNGRLQTMGHLGAIVLLATQDSTCSVHTRLCSVDLCLHMAVVWHQSAPCCEFHGGRVYTCLAQNPPHCPCGMQGVNICDTRATRLVSASRCFPGVLSVNAHCACAACRVSTFVAATEEPTQGCRISSANQPWAPPARFEKGVRASTIQRYCCAMYICIYVYIYIYIDIPGCLL